MCIAFLHYNVQWSLNVPCTVEHNFVGCLHTPGSGLHCQRAISAICELAGLKNMRAKIIGSTNPLNIVRAVFKGLTSQVSIVSTMTQYSNWVDQMAVINDLLPSLTGINKVFFELQETHQSLADKTGLFLVEYRRECSYRPVVIAVPKSQDSSSTIEKLQALYLMPQQVSTTG